MRLMHTEINEWGVARRYYADDMTGEITVAIEQDAAPIVEENKRKANENGKAIASEVACPAASIPVGVILKWFHEEGWWVYDANKDPDVERKLNQKLNDSEWRHLRTSELVI